MEAVALHDFHATAEDELSFKKGSVLKVSVCVRMCACNTGIGWISQRSALQTQDFCTLYFHIMFIHVTQFSVRILVM